MFTVRSRESRERRKIKNSLYVKSVLVEMSPRCTSLNIKVLGMILRRENPH